MGFIIKRDNSGRVMLTSFTQTWIAWYRGRISDADLIRAHGRFGCKRAHLFPEESGGTETEDLYPATVPGEVTWPGEDVTSYNARVQRNLCLPQTLAKWDRFMELITKLDDFCSVWFRDELEGDDDPILLVASHTPPE